MRQCKSNPTKRIKKTINEIVDEYLVGKMTYEECLERVWSVGEPVWKSLILEFQKKCKGYIQLEDLEASAYEAVATALRYVKPDRNAFSYIRGYVRGYLLNQINAIAFPFRVRSGDNVQVERVLIDVFDDKPDNDETCLIPDALITYDGFAEVEIRDILKRLLTPTERKITTMLMDGYEPEEIMSELRLKPAEYNELVASIRRKLGREMGLDGVGGDGGVEPPFPVPH